MEKPKLVEVLDTEVRIDFSLNCKCRATVRLKSLSSTNPIAFKIQTSSPHKFLVNPPTGLIFPLSSTTFQIILRPQTHPPPTFPRSPSDSFLVKTAPFHPEDSSHSTLASWFSSLPPGWTRDFKLKVAFVGPFLLRHAVGRGDLDSVKNILKRQKSILAELPQGEAESLLRVATGLGVNSEGMVNMLLEAGLKIEACVTAAESVGCVYQVDSKWESKGWSELHVAVAFDRTEEVSELAKRYGALDLRDKEGRVPLHLAASRGNIRCAKILVESGADKDAKSKDGRTALHRAVANDSRRMVQMLIDIGADPTIADDLGRTAFDVARDKGHEEVLKILERGELTLMAARQGELERLGSLLKRGASVNYRDQYGFTALHAAAIKGHTCIVSKLVEYGLDLESQDKEGHTPLHLAVEGGCKETVKMLVNKGANVNAKSNQGTTPLYIAKAIGYNDISQFLVNKGAFSSARHSFSYPLSPMLQPT